MRKGLFVWIALLGLAAAACGSGGGGSKDDTPVPQATSVAVDVSLLRPVVLRPTDVPAGYSQTGFPAPEGVSFTSAFIGEGRRIQSTVVYFETPKLAEEEFTRNRKVLPALSAGTRESNYQIPGADAAFLYRVYGPPGLATWALRGNFMILVQTAPTDYANPSPIAIDEAEFARLSGLVLGRVAMLVETPELVTPIAAPASPGAAPTSPAASPTP